jgi:hypothetical protein
MHMLTRGVVLVLVTGIIGCSRGPGRDEALVALRRSNPTYETTPVYDRVWQDGPPWFSCAEILAKIDGTADREVVRDAVGNWRSLVLAGWIVLRDSTYGPVADPGWCTVKLTDAGALHATGWPQALGPEFPTGTRRRGWMAPVGVRKVEVVGAPRPLGADFATAEYIVTIAPNENGVGTGAARDTLRYIADLHRVNGQWRMGAVRPVAPKAP